MKRLLTVLAVLVCHPAFAGQPLVVHEWGTFTSLQDESGRAIGYLNSSDERLPEFVHRLRSNLLRNDASIFSKGLGPAHPDVTMRLETPVIYFHPTDKTPFNVDITATFRGGLLSEFYPYGKFHIEGGYPAPAGVDRITASTEGSITWKGLKVGGDVKFPETTEHVWLAPRNVDAAPVSVGTEGEKYVFYRGVGHIDAPIRSTRRGDNLYLENVSFDHANFNELWLVEIRENGSCAWSQLDALAPAGRLGELKPIPATFAESSQNELPSLRESMKVSLVKNGLFADEADAMLNTWEASYFKSPGMRLLFLVPRAWTDHYLPLKISVPNELTRVMVGRIEIVSAKQRSALKALATTPIQNQSIVLKSMGRFGYALVLDELRQRPDEALAKIARIHDIRSFAPATQPVTIGLGN